jgi:hypothetical protein
VVVRLAASGRRCACSRADVCSPRQQYEASSTTTPDAPPLEVAADVVPDEPEIPAVEPEAESEAEVATETGTETEAETTEERRKRKPRRRRRLHHDEGDTPQ